MPEQNLTFWGHLDELKKVLVRVVLVVIVVSSLAFMFKEEVFSLVLAPGQSDFVTYRFFCRLSEWLVMPALCPESFQVELISTQLASQFMIHMSVSMYVGILLVSPYILYQLYRFISPALYADERKYSVRVVCASYILFIAGSLLNYFMVFPLAFRFLATYQVDDTVKNCITLASYVDTFMMLTLAMGIVFEIPVLSWFFAKLGLINDGYMRKYRRHAIVAILIVAAIITPTSDIFTLLLVSLPMYALYEGSIQVVKRVKLKDEL